MFKLLKLAAIGTLALGLAGPALAQSSMKDTVMTKDQSMRTSKVIGMTVYNDAGDKIGAVLDVLIRTGTEPQAIVNVGDYLGGSKLVAIPLAKLNLEGAKPMMMGATKAMLMALPAYPGEFGSG